MSRFQATNRCPSVASQDMPILPPNQKARKVVRQGYGLIRRWLHIVNLLQTQHATLWSRRQAALSQSHVLVVHAR